VSQHDFDPTKLGGQPLPPQGGLLRDLEGCAARLAQQISTTPVDATNLILPLKDFQTVQHRGQTAISMSRRLSGHNRTP